MATTIEVSDETWRQLNARKDRGESFDDVIQELLPPVISVGPEDIVATEDGYELAAEEREGIAEYLNDRFNEEAES